MYILRYLISYTYYGFNTSYDIITIFSISYIIICFNLCTIKSNLDLCKIIPIARNSRVYGSNPFLNLNNYHMLFWKTSFNLIRNQNVNDASKQFFLIFILYERCIRTTRYDLYLFPFLLLKRKTSCVWLLLQQHNQELVSQSILFSFPHVKSQNFFENHFVIHEVLWKQYCLTGYKTVFKSTKNSIDVHDIYFCGFILILHAIFKVIEYTMIWWINPC